ncbi:MAG: hypothetical protein K2M12_05540, partial [Muribaculaceae bacterium]|nr:hypothetical protein [Muribaculaceae bacterium]
QVVMPTYETCRDTLFRNRAFACEDLQLLMTLAREADAEYLPIVSLCYNVGSSQAITSQDNAAKSVCFTLASLRLRLELARLFKLDTPGIRRSEANAFAFALGTAIDSGDKSLVRDVLRLAGEMRFIRVSTRVRMFFAKYCNFFC